MKKDDVIYSVITGLVLGYIGGVFLAITVVIALEVIGWFFYLLAKLQYRRLGAQKADKKLAEKLGVREVWLINDKNVFHGYRGMILIPKDYDGEIVKLAKELSQKQPPGWRDRFTGYSIIIILAGLIQLLL